MNVDVTETAIEPAVAADADAIEQLIAAAGLPPDGVRDALDAFVVVRDGEAIVAVAGLERPRQVADGGRHQSVVRPRAAALAGHEAGAAQDREVVADGRLGQA